MATFSERIELLIDAKAGGAITEMRKLSAATDTVSQKQSQATGITGMYQRGLDKMGISADAAGAALKGALAAGAVAAGYAMLRFGQQSVDAFVGLADKVRGVQQAMGGTAESASRLVAITDDYGISASAATRSLAFMAKSVRDNTDELASYGVQVVKARDGSVDMERTLLNVAEAYENTSDPAARAELVMKAFGRSGRDLIPILEQGKNGIREMFDAVPDKQILSDEDLRSAREFQLAMDDLNDVLKEAQINIGRLLVPAVAEYAEVVAFAARATFKLKEVLDSIQPGGGPFGALKDALIESAPVIGPFIGLARDMSSAVGDSKESTDGLSLSTDRMTDSMRSASGALADASAKTTDLFNITMQLWNVQLGVEGATLNLQGAVERYSTTVADATSTELERANATYGMKTSLTALMAQTLEQAAATRGLTVDQLDAATKAQLQRDKLEELRQKFPELIPVINEYVASLDRIPAARSTTLFIDAVLTGASDAVDAARRALGRASGGPVSAGQPYIVGEVGPELFVPNTSGTIIPNGASSGGSAGAGTVNLVLDGTVLGQAVVDFINRKATRGPGPLVSSAVVA